VRAPTAGRAVVGVFGLLWFLFFVVSAAWGLLRPDELRSYSSYSWTDREIRICAICYLMVGSAGGIVAFRRLIMPLFARRPLIGRNAAPCLASVGVTPSYPDFEAVHMLSVKRRLAWSIASWVFAMTVVYGIFALLPFLRGNLSPSLLGLHTVLFLTACAIGIAFRFVRSPRAEIVWAESPHLRESCRLDFFDDGIHVYGWNFGIGVPWDQVRRAERVGHALALHIPRSYLIIPATAVPEAGGADLLDLLRRKRKIRGRV
jgi:hypothetical protein